MADASQSRLVYAALLILAVAAVYAPGLNNGLLFDDLRLQDGTIFERHGSLAQFKARMLSYGSFVWVQQLFGEGWWKQRIVNVALHLGVVAALYAFLQALVGTARFPASFEEHEHFARSRTAALRVGVALFALNPVAVYAVAYLTQRSIVMATLLALLACWAFVRGLRTRRWPWFAGALLAYALAVLAKEYAVMTAALSVPLYLYVRRPTWQQAALIVAGALVLVGAAIAVLLGLYGNLIGNLIDDQSVDFVRQLEAVQPGVGARMYALSILNEAALFFRYGLLWALPNVQWMSIDLRPAFPLSFASPWHLAGALAYVALLLAALWLVVRRSDLWGLAALLLLMPLLLYATEFAVVWVQDPFVLYRSYLWAVALPGLLAIVLTGFRPRSIYIAGIVVGIAFAALATERVLSLRDAGSAWADATEKIDTQAPANAVGRSRAFLNLGSYRLEKGLYAQAERDFATADALGDPRGNARFSIGMALQQQKRHAEALKAFDAAQARGYSGQSLHFQRGESAMAVGDFALAFRSFDAAGRAPAETDEGSDKLLQLIALRRAEAAIGANQFDAAIEGFTELLKQSPGNPRLEMGLGMALVGKGDSRRALALFDQLLARTPTAAVFYGRGMAHRAAGDLAASLKDMDQALRLDPRNAQFRSVREQIAAEAARGGAARPAR